MSDDYEALRHLSSGSKTLHNIMHPLPILPISKTLGYSPSPSPSPPPADVIQISYIPSHMLPPGHPLASTVPTDLPENLGTNAPIPVLPSYDNEPLDDIFDDSPSPSTLASPRSATSRMSTSPPTNDDAPLTNDDDDDTHVPPPQSPSNPAVALPLIVPCPPPGPLPPRHPPLVPPPPSRLHSQPDEADLEETLSDLPQQRRQHMTDGYREGLSISKTKHVQVGFDEGYPVGAAVGARVGYVLGVLEGLRVASSMAAGHAGVGEASGKEGEGEGVRGVLEKARRELSLDSLFDLDATEPGEHNDEAGGGDVRVSAAAEERLREWEDRVQRILLGAEGVDGTVLGNSV